MAVLSEIHRHIVIWQRKDLDDPTTCALELLCMRSVLYMVAFAENKLQEISILGCRGCLANVFDYSYYLQNFLACKGTGFGVWKFSRACPFHRRATIRFSMDWGQNINWVGSGWTQLNSGSCPKFSGFDDSGMLPRRFLWRNQFNSWSIPTTCWQNSYTQSGDTHGLILWQQGVTSSLFPKSHQCLAFADQWAVRGRMMLIT